MKKLVLLLLLAFVIIAISPMMIDEKGYILIAINDITIESTVVGATILLVVFFLAVLLLFKLASGSLKLSALGWHKIAFASRRRALANFHKGIAAYLIEDYQQAEQLLAKSAGPSKLEHSAYLLAAVAAEKQARSKKSQHYLALLNQQPATTKTQLAPLVVQLKLLLAHHNKASQAELEQTKLDQARQLIEQHRKEVSQDHRLLSLAIDLCLLEHNYQQAIEQLALARKNKFISAERLNAWEESAYYGYFNQLITEKDNKALQNYWLALPKKLRQQPSIIYAYCRVLAQHKISNSLSDIIYPALKKGANKDFILKIRCLSVHHAEPLIQLVQKHLHKAPNNALWLSCLAHLAAGDKQWQMAEKAFNSLLNLAEPAYDSEDLLTFASVLTHLTKHEKANEVLRKMLCS